MSTLPQTLDVQGVAVTPLRRHELLDVLAAWSADPAAPRRMYYANAHVLNLAQRDVAFRRSLNGAELVIFEGYGSCLCARLSGAGEPEQLATMDWMDDFLSLLADRRARVYLVGDEPGVAERCAAEMRRRHPGLEVVGTRDGYFDVDGPEDAEVVASIAAARPDVLLVGMGSPRQEHWIDERLDRLGAPLVLALGAMFRWYGGAERRAPAWLRRLHLEWLLRLLKHPVRHFRRYVLGNPTLLVRCTLQRLRATAR